MKIDPDFDFDTDDLIIYDEEAASFSLKSWRISVNEDQEKLAKVVTAPELPDDAKTLSVLAHEYHHWVYSFHSTYGLLVNIFRYEAANNAVTLANILSSTSDLKKPAIDCLIENISNYGPKKEIEQFVQGYTNTKKFLNLLIGQKTSPYSSFCKLLPEIIEVFQRTKNNISRRNFTKTTERILDLQHRWTTGHKLKPLELDDAFINLLKTKASSLIEKKDYETDLHLQMNEYERINWPVFLESHAKYFQRAYESVMLSIANEHSENKTHNVMHDLKDYEKWSSPYSCLMRLKFYIKGNDRKFCQACEIIELLALADLAVNPSLNAEYFFPNEKFQSMQTLFPGQRFAWACTAAKETKSIALRLVENGMEPGSLESAYKAFISDCCSWLKWETPWEQAHRWLKHYSEFKDGEKSGFAYLDHFLEGCRLRLEQPLFFGIPSHASKQHNDQRHTWLSLLCNSLTTPNFASRENPPSFSLGGKPPTISSLQYDAINHEILDQLMTCSGPFNWDIITESLGKDRPYNNMVLGDVIKNFSTYGINLHNIAH